MYQTNSPIEFSIERTLPLRGLMALLIICVHLSQVFGTYGGVFQTINIGAFSYWSRPIVAIFFFISGFGLTKSYNIKGKSYLDRFLRKRFGRLLLPFGIATFLYVVTFKLINANGGGELPSFTLEEWQRGFPWLPTSWFVIAILTYYLLFYLTALTTHKSGKIVFTLWIITPLCMITLQQSGFASYWYETLPSFNIGMTVALYEKGVERILKSKWKLMATLLFACYAAFFVSDCLITDELISGWRLSIIMQSALCSLLVYVLVSVKGFPQGKFLQTMGHISYEIYLLQGAVIAILFGLVGSIPALYVTATFTLSIIIAYCLHQVCLKIKW